MADNDGDRGDRPTKKQYLLSGGTGEDGSALAYLVGNRSAGIAPTDFDPADRREAAILAQLASEGVVLWRSDGNRSGGPDDGGEVQLVGVVAGEDGPELFQASSWVSWGTNVNVRIQLQAPLADVCRAFLPGTGPGLAARELHDRGHEAAVAAAVDGTAKYVASWANQHDGLFTLRVSPSGGGEKRIAVAHVGWDGEAYNAKVEFEATFGELLDWAEETFGRASAPRR